MDKINEPVMIDYDVIYVGSAGENYQSLINDENKIDTKTKELFNSFELTAGRNGDNKFYIIVPYENKFINYIYFTVGGAPLVMDAFSDVIDGERYRVFRTAAVYNDKQKIIITAFNN